MRRPGDAVFAFRRRMGPFRRRRFRAQLALAGSVAMWTAGLLGTLLVAFLAFAGLQSGQ